MEVNSESSDFSSTYTWTTNSSFFLAILGTLTSAIIFVYFKSTSRVHALIEKIPGPPALPILGNALLVRPGGSGFMKVIWGSIYRYNIGKSRVVRLWLGDYPYVLLFGADTVEVLFNSSKHMTKSRDYEFLQPWLGTGLLTSTGDKWKTRRRLLTPTFHFRILNDFLQVFNEQAQTLVQKLTPLADGREFNIFPYITLCALDIICETAMGQSVNAQHDSESEYVKSIVEISELIQTRQKSPWLWPDWLYSLTPSGKLHQKCLNVLHGCTETVIKQRAAELNKFLESDEGQQAQRSGDDDELPSSFGLKKRLAFLDMLLYAARDGADLDFMGIREEVDTFMFEGHDTTAAAMAWATHLLGRHPEVQRKAQEELDMVLGPESRPVTMDDLRKLTYLERVVKEALRLYPSVPIFGRTLSEDCVIGGYEVPAGTTALVVTSILHRDPTYFPDPEKFDPDRWLPDRAAERHPYCYVPFSAGHRNCIGQKFALNEEKAVLAAVLHHFNIESCDHTEDLQPVGELILRPGVGVKVKITKRNPTD